MKYKNILIGGVGFLVVAGLAGASAHFYLRYQHSQTLLKNPTAAAQEEVKKLTDQVGKHFLLPDSEIPTVATVSDTSKLANQAFFARAEVGDRVLIYSQAAKAVLFRPSADRIIEVVALSNPEVAGESTAAAQLQTARLAIYNSTDTVGLASVAQQKVNKEMPSTMTVTSKQNSIGSFDRSIIVVLTPEARSLGDRLGEMFNAEVIPQIPEGEIKPDTDLLLIVGQDFADSQ